MSEMPNSFAPYVSVAFPCRLCGQSIRMIRTEKDKSMPLDAQAIKVTTADLTDGEPFRLIDRFGRLRIHLVGEIGFYTHFGTCLEYHGAMPPPESWGVPGKAQKAPNPTRRSLSHMLDRLDYIEQSLGRIGKLHKARFEPKHLLQEIGHIQKFIKHTKEIIGE